MSLRHLLDLNANYTLVLWIRQFLYDWPQKVSIGGALSDELIVNTGTPQVSVLSPMLFSIYTNEVVPCTLLTLVKNTDDMALVAHLQEARFQDENGLTQYFLHTDLLNSWFKESLLF